MVSCEQKKDLFVVFVELKEFVNVKRITISIHIWKCIESINWIDYNKTL